MRVERTGFDRAKQEIGLMLEQMGNQVSDALGVVMSAFRDRDRKRARQVIEGDRDLNRQYDQIHDACVVLIAREQPVATELRQLVADIQIAAELERMADHVADIGKTVLGIDDHPLPPVLDQLEVMTTKCQEMLNQVLSAHRERDGIKAAGVAGEDDQVDRLNGEIVQRAIAFMQQDPAAIMNGTQVIWCTHHLERIADRVTNIAEQINFIEKGETVDLNRS
jgi:phosphate transport system protein